MKEIAEQIALHQVYIIKNESMIKKVQKLNNPIIFNIGNGGAQNGGQGAFPISSQNNKPSTSGASSKCC